MARMIFALLGMLLVMAANAANLTPVEALNVAGRQRMLTQRIVKAYVQMAIDVAPERSREVLEAAVVQFDNQLADLRAFASNDQQRSSIAEMSLRWRRLRVLALAPLDPRNIAVIDSESEELLALSELLVEQIEESSKVYGARQLNLAGRQRMLCQRLVKLYMLRAKGDNSSRVRAEMDRAVTEFGAGLAFLKQARQTDMEIKRELDAIAQNWEWFKQALELDGAVSYRLLVADSSEAILASLEHIVSLYEKLQLK